jgi:hypothetical protein
MISAHYIAPTGIECKKTRDERLSSDRELRYQNTLLYNIYYGIKL